VDKSSDELIFEYRDGIGAITLNRPEKKNALSGILEGNIIKVLAEAKKRDDVKVLILTGKGDGFCAGADVGQRISAYIVRGDAAPEEKLRSELLDPGWVVLPRAFASFGKPIIGAINGVAAGAGLSLACYCDIRIASEKARFVASWIKRGLIPDAGGSFFLPRVVGVENALKLCYTGEAIDAAEAKRINLVSQVVPHEELMKAAMNLADRIACGPSVAVELTHRLVWGRYFKELSDHLNLENHAMDICINTIDFKEGVNSFLEKREPKYKGI